MNTQDPYRDLSEMKRRDEYPGYDEFLPYRNDWHYSFGIFSILMVAALVLGYWKLQPESNAPLPTAPIAKVVTTANPVKVPTVKPAEQATKPAVPAAAKASKVIAKERKPEAVSTTTPPEVKPEPIRTVTAPPSR